MWLSRGRGYPEIYSGLICDFKTMKGVSDLRLKEAFWFFLTESQCSKVENSELK